VAADWRGMLATRLAPGHFSALTMPVLLVGGSQSTRAARRILDLLGPLLADPRRMLLPGLNHMAPISQPERVLPLFADFLAEMAARQPVAGPVAAA
jgi:pimeloyl-ACP methyl ester carboxylesterase